MMTPSNHDLRAFLSEVDKIGELRRIENIPWDKDLGGLVEMILERSAHPPAMLFEKIPGARQDTEVLCSQIDTLPRLAIAMGTDPQLGLTDFIQAWRRKIRNFEPVPAQFIKDAPILENRVDKNIDLEAFPIPRWHEEDGGRYIGTDDLVVTEDPEEHWINAGTYRVMLQGKDAVALYISPGKHGRVQRQKYFDVGKPCPVVMSFGHHPILFLAACTDVPVKMSEFDYAGGVIGEPIQLVRGPLTGLPIPAYSEIAIEGEMIPGDDLPEGPFGESWLLRQRDAAGAGRAHQSALLQKQSDTLRRAAAAPIGGTGLSPLDSALGADLECAGGRRRPRRSRRVASPRCL